MTTLLPQGCEHILGYSYVGIDLSLDLDLEGDLAMERGGRSISVGVRKGCAPMGWCASVWFVDLYSQPLEGNASRMSHSGGVTSEPTNERIKSYVAYL